MLTATLSLATGVVLQAPKDVAADVGRVRPGA
jgi:hypothetical protein